MTGEDGRFLIDGLSEGTINVFVHGAEMGSNEPSLERIRQIDPQRPFLQLPNDFSSAEASRMGSQLVDRIRSLLGPAPHEGRAGLS